MSLGDVDFSRLSFSNSSEAFGPPVLFLSGIWATLSASSTSLTSSEKKKTTRNDIIDLETYVSLWAFTGWFVPTSCGDVGPFLADVAHPVDVKTIYKRRHSIATSFFINVLETNNGL